MISGDRIPNGTTITAIDSATGRLTLSNNLTALGADGKTTTTTGKVLAQNGQALTLASTSSLTVGMQVRGDGLDDGTVITAINAATVHLSAAPTGTVAGLVASSPLSVEGSLNNMAATGTVGVSGRNGSNGNAWVPLFTDGEGLPGTNGQNARGGSGAAGGIGGHGGNGSAGIAFNDNLLHAVIDATSDAIDNTGEAASALATFAPNVAAPVGAVVSAVQAYIALALAINNAVQWGQGLVEGATRETTLGPGIHAASTIVFAGTGQIRNTGADQTGALVAHANAGVLLVNEDISLRVGPTVPGQIMWNGAGGFAAGTADGITLNLARPRIAPARAWSGAAARSAPIRRWCLAPNTAWAGWNEKRHQPQRPNRQRGGV